MAPKKLTADDVGAKVIGILDFVLDIAVMILFLILITFSIYSIVDAKNLYDGGSALQFQEYRPSQGEEYSFEKLQKINSDVKCWLTIYGTEIDYPVCYAEDETKYLNTDAKGEYSLSGALFFDADCSPDFSDYRTIIYGHHMDKDKMFGGLDDFKDKDFFKSRRYGNVYVNGRNYGFEIFAVFDSDAYDKSVYGGDGNDIMNVISDRAVNLRSIDIGSDDHIVLLSTCAGGLTNSRLVVAGKLTDETYKDTFREYPKGHESSFFERIPVWWYILAGIIVGILILLIHIRKKQDDEEEEEENNLN